MLRLWKLAGCLMVIFYGTMFIGADAASGNESSTAWVFQTVHDCTTSGGSADLSRLRLKRSEELLGHKETGIHMPGVIPLHACCPTGVEMSVGDSQTPALMPGCIEEFGGGLHARQTDLKDPTLKGGVSAERDESYAVLGGLGLRLISHLGSPTICTVLVCHGTCEFMFGPPCKLISSAKAISNVIWHD